MDTPTTPASPPENEDVEAFREQVRAARKDLYQAKKQAGLPVASAAAALDVSRYTLYRWIRKGEIPADLIDGQWYVTRAAITGYIARLRAEAEARRPRAKARARAAA